MGWPDWIDTLRDRYLADEGNVFLLHGDLGARFPIEGEALDVVEVLVRFLSRTRQIVGVVRPDEPLTFPNLGDRGRFERLVAAREVVMGSRFTRDSTAAEQVLGLAWASLSGTGVDQAWIVTDVHRILPGHRKRVEALGADAPPLWDWPRRLQHSNDIVVLLAPSPGEVRVELVDAAVLVEVVAPPEPRRAEAVPEPARYDAEAEIEAFLASRGPAVEPPVVEPPAPPPAPPATSAPSDGSEDEGPLPTVSDLGAALEAALEATLPAHAVSTWPGRLPVIDAVARVLSDYDDRVGALEVGADDEGQPIASGPGADWFLARWRGDIALDAAAGMLLRGIEVPDGASHVTGPVALDPTAMRALAKRLRRVLTTA